MLWEWIAAIVSAVGAITGSGYAIKKVVEHEQRTCDARLQAYKNGLAHGEGQREKPPS
jgi:hypothetical protein